MKTARPITLLALALTMFLSGCQQTPLQQSLSLRATYTEAVAGLNLAYRHKLIDLEDKVAINPYRLAARDAVDAVESAARTAMEATTDQEKEAATSAFERVRVAAVAALGRLAVEHQKLQEQKRERDARPRPATLPAR